MLLADRVEAVPKIVGRRIDPSVGKAEPETGSPSEGAVHELANEFELGVDEILGIIAQAPRLKMAVRGWVAEEHLGKLLADSDDVVRFEKLEKDGQPDFEVQFKARAQPCKIECKNVLRKAMADGTIKVDFQKTRASKSNPCSRFYQPSEFEVLAACLHARTEVWEFRFQLTRIMPEHSKCSGHLGNNVRVESNWAPDLAELARRL